MKLLSVLLLAMAGPAVAQAPALSQMKDWQAGAWEARPQGQKSGASRCLAAPDSMLFNGGSGAGCKVTVISDTAGKGAISYSCPDGRSGRTDVRRDNEDTYMVDAQGVDSGLPFATRIDWRRVGACTAAK